MSECSTNISEKSNFPSRFYNINFAANANVANALRRRRETIKSPYPVKHKAKRNHRILDKKVVQNKETNIISSFPMAANIYKASSDEFKPLKCNRKVKKSVLTLPSERNFIQERYTVSDSNDSEYFNKDESSNKLRPKKRIARQSNKKVSNLNKDFEFYHNMNTRYRSHMNNYLDSVNNDINRHFDGDRKRVPLKIKPHLTRKSQGEKQCNAYNVWKLLRNMNRFQFRPSPPVSDETMVTPRKKKVLKRKRKDLRFIGTCRTEEFAYISSFEVDSRSKSFSQTSSFDRITVIDKQDDFSNLCEDFEKTIVRNVTVNNCSPARNTIHIKNNPRVNKLYKSKDNQTNTVDNTAIGRRNENQFKDDNCKENAAVYSTGPLNTINSKQKQKIDDLEESRDSFIHSCNSGSSRAACNYLKENEKSLKLSSDESSQYMKGITKVVLSKDQHRTNLQNRKPRLFTTIPRTTITPKPTQADIKRRIANIKFPLVILDKEQVSSTIQVIDFYDHPQFSGLDKHIWPFMLEWNDEFSRTAKNVKTQKNFGNYITKSKQNTVENKFSNLHKSNKIMTKERRSHKTDSFIKQKLIEEKQIVSKIKQPIHHVKDKLLKLLYKKLPTTSLDEEIHQIKVDDVKKVVSKTIWSQTDFVPNLNSKCIPIVKESSKKGQINFINPVNMIDKLSRVNISKTNPMNLVETITKNIKNGVYYNGDQKYFKNIHETTSKEISIQTALNDIQEVQIDQVESLRSSTSTEIISEHHSLLEAILGFGHTLPEIEIKTFNLNKIEVKHRLSNILVQFDVTTTPINPNINLKGFKKSYSFIPLKVTGHETKTFKCKTSILNAVLPAELCTLIPKIIRKLLTFEMKSPSVLPVSKTELNMSMISELSYFEKTDYLKLSQVHLHCFIDGLFFKPINTNSNQFIDKFEWGKRTRLLDLSPAEANNKLFFPCIPNFRELICLNELRTINTSIKSNDIPFHKKTYCSTVQPYNWKNWTVSLIFKPYDFNDVISNVYNCSIYSSVSVTPKISLLAFDLNANEINVKILLNEVNKDKVFLGLNDLKTDRLYGNLSNTLPNKIECSNGKITKVEIPVCKTTNLSQVKQCKRLRRKEYVRLYKKCKSTTNICSERQSTSLNKIENLDDFFELLGCRKCFSIIFDGNAGRKVMTSIAEMKNWLSEINSNQAFLVLLLVNKKDTPNLVRFRPILLQGIAVSRITKVSELDMEIEVIERENLSSSLQIEGISYLPDSVENKDNLLQELYWIAKTTASDYQKPFDESSEKHLKSLLESRKKLNPSYLRLLARYVGLGLLKSPLRK